MQCSRKIVSRHAQKITFCQQQSTIVHHGQRGLTPYKVNISTFSKRERTCQTRAKLDAPWNCIVPSLIWFAQGTFPCKFLPLHTLPFQNLLLKQILSILCCFFTIYQKSKRIVFGWGFHRDPCLAEDKAGSGQVPCCTNPNLYCFILSHIPIQRATKLQLS